MVTGHSFPNANDKRLYKSLYSHDLRSHAVPDTMRGRISCNTKDLQRRVSFALKYWRIKQSEDRSGSLRNIDAH